MENKKRLLRDIEVKNIFLRRENELIEAMQPIIEQGICNDWFKVDGSLKKKHEHIKEDLQNLERKYNVEINDIDYHVNMFGTYFSIYPHRDSTILLRSRICVSGEPDKNDINSFCNYEDIHLYINKGIKLEKKNLINPDEIITTIERKEALRKELAEIDCPYLYWFDKPRHY